MIPNRKFSNILIHIATTCASFLNSVKTCHRPIAISPRSDREPKSQSLPSFSPHSPRHCRNNHVQMPAPQEPELQFDTIEDSIAAFRKSSHFHEHTTRLPEQWPMMCRGKPHSMALNARSSPQLHLTGLPNVQGKQQRLRHRARLSQPRK